MRVPLRVALALAALYGSTIRTEKSYTDAEERYRGEFDALLPVLDNAERAAPGHQAGAAPGLGGRSERPVRRRPALLVTESWLRAPLGETSQQSDVNFQFDSPLEEAAVGTDRARRWRSRCLLRCPGCSYRCLPSCSAVSTRQAVPTTRRRRPAWRHRAYGDLAARGRRDGHRRLAVPCRGAHLGGCLSCWWRPSRASHRRRRADVGRGRGRPGGRRSGLYAAVFVAPELSWSIRRPQNGRRSPKSILWPTAVFNVSPDAISASVVPVNR